MKKKRKPAPPMREFYFKYNNKTSRMLAKLAKAIGLQDERGWKEDLAKALGTTSNTMSNWVKRDSADLDLVWKLMEKYRLPSNILWDGEVSQRAYFDGNALAEWPWLDQFVDLVNQAAKIRDRDLLYRTFQYGVDCCKREGASEGRDEGSEKR